MIRYDLHLHTSASDGIYTPNEICTLAKEHGLVGISITDHDTVDAYHELTAEQRLMVIPGIEINTDYQGEEVHILGYFINIEHEPLLQKIEEIRKLRKNRLLKMVDKISGLGIPLTWEHVLNCAGNGSPGRAHIGMAMVHQGLTSSIEEAMQRYLSRGAPAYVERYHFTPREAILLIRAAGGSPVLAHPGLINSEQIIQEVIQMGVDGIEVYHTQHGPKQEEEYQLLAQRHSLLITGGSDFHGFIDERHAEFPGNKGLTEEKFADFLSKRKRIANKNVEFN